MKNIFDNEESALLVKRINTLDEETTAIWGTMNAAQMLAHCNVSYETIFEPEKNPKPNAVVKLLLKIFVKPMVVGLKPYAKNGQTAPIFKITSEKNFIDEREKLVKNIKKVQQLGEAYFNGKESYSLGILSKEEWNNLFYKHLDHHLTQFGA